jgi:hypothetical protein
VFPLSGDFSRGRGFRMENSPCSEELWEEKDHYTNSTVKSEGIWALPSNITALSVANTNIGQRPDRAAAAVTGRSPPEGVRWRTDRFGAEFLRGSAVESAPSYRADISVLG